MSDTTNSVLERARAAALDATGYILREPADYDPAVDGFAEEQSRKQADAAMREMLTELEQFGQGFYPPSGKGGPTKAVPMKVIHSLLKELGDA